jgi:RND family efflux transporter MFP subunit
MAPISDETRTAMRKINAIFVILLALAIAASGACASGKGGGDEAKADENKPAEGTVVLSPEAAKTAKIEIGEARVRAIYPTVKASGTVALNQKKYVRVTPRVAGRIEKVLAFDGDRVRAGQELFLLYSPDLLAVQGDYLQILSRVSEQPAGAPAEDTELNESLLRSTESRLKLLGFEDADIKALRASRQALPVLPVRSPISGTVIGPCCDSGCAVEVGAPLCAVADLSSLWVQVHIFEKDLSLVAPGAKAEIVVTAYPGEVFSGKLTLVGAIMEEATRTVTGRVEAPNPEGRLKPGMFAEVRIVAREPISILAVPEQAIRTVAGRSVVFVPGGEGTYVRRDVETGRTVDGFVEILKGLKDGERVVTGGSFDIKAEMLKGALEGEG